MILLWGVMEDPPLAAVRAALDRRGTAYVLLDQRTVVDHFRFTFGASLSGHVDGLDLDEVSATYLRPFGYAELPEHAEAPDAVTRLRRLQTFEHHFHAWLECTPSLVVTPLLAQASNASKLAQSQVIAAHGFSVPVSLATTSTEAARRFPGAGRPAIYKSLSSVRSIVGRVDLAALADDAALADCPTLFQEQVPGTDYRVTVVGDRAFATMVHSTSNDYRYDRTAERIAVELPDELIDRCHALCRALGFPLAGLDLRRAADGRWCCFEVNPSPAFTYYEPPGGTPIADALADLLEGAPVPDHAAA